jgi:hypothetical protein
MTPAGDGAWHRIRSVPADRYRIERELAAVLGA